MIAAVGRVKSEMKPLNLYSGNILTRFNAIVNVSFHCKNL
ncbi:hypothetical protein PAMC26510_13645 [Caballeronia sordidicola]|uniref:Uncharacterized protein n=1 Tax=Caballeronia sordidicola TaxID=196367 RepID=A0A242MVK9_CABSO|nr:hypothetical protein PAMC26510_13645 [Caballeronia sordidicola]